MAFPRRRPHVASPDEVRITRQGDAAVIEYGDPNIAITYFTIGAEKLATMTDADILARWNDGLEATEELRRSLTYVATEVPVGEPQLKSCELSGDMVTRGDIVRCIIEDRPEEADDIFVSVDGQDLTLLQFAKMLGKYTGWGMRIEIVPDDELHERPKRRVRVPKKNQRCSFGAALSSAPRDSAWPYAESAARYPSNPRPPGPIHPACRPTTSTARTTGCSATRSSGPRSQKASCARCFHRRWWKRSTSPR